MTEIEPVTLQEAQFLVGRSLDDINKAIERGEVEKLLEFVIEPARAKRAKIRLGSRDRRPHTTSAHGHAPARTVTQKVRKLGQHELVYLALGRDVHDSFTPSARKRLYEAIKIRPEGADRVRIGPVDVLLKPAIAQLKARYRVLRDVRTGIVERADAEPVFKGTELPVYLIAALAEGQGVDDTLADYPSLKRKQVARALDYARAYPKKGRPYPARSLKRAIADLAAAGIFDAADDAPKLAPADFQ